MKTIRWGILGCGDVCERKSGPAFQQADHSALMAVMRRSGLLAADFARRHGVSRWYDDAEALVADPEVDAVYVAAPPGSHLDLARLAARARKPAYVEKPMARSHGECLEMLEAFRAAATPLFVAYYRRSLPRFLKVKELLDRGAIGTVRSVSVALHQKPQAATSVDRARAAMPAGAATAASEAAVASAAASRASSGPGGGVVPWRLVPEIAGAGLFLDLASHTLDLLDFLLGPIVEARGLAANQSGAHRVEDAVAASFAFAGGALGTGGWFFSSSERQDRVEIVGSSGRIEFATFAEEPVRWHSAGGVEEFTIAHPPHIQQPLIQSVVLELNGIGRCPSTGGTAARTSKVMDDILQDFRSRLVAPESA